MCGIAGYVGSVVGESQERVAVMAEAIAHRGPDDAGMWVGQDVVLAHRRLSIIDTTVAGHQPMASRCGRYVLTYNGEIYNFVELRTELEERGVLFHSHSDSEVLLAAFSAWGAECVTRFNGMWAFAIWDRLERRLFVSRDRFGEKPFYYTLRNGEFWFASEIKALLAAGVAGRAPNPRAVADFSAERVTDHTEETFFLDVKQLPPASCGWLDSGQLRLTRYWALPLDDPTPHRKDIVEEVRALFEDAVRLRLRSDVSVGVLLSGGLDSSAVSSLAAQFSSTPIAAFSTISKPPPEEALGIDAVLGMQSNLRLHLDDPGDDCLDQELAHCLWHQEEPFADGSMLAHFRLMRIARANGVRVLLTGQGADEVFAGYPGFQAVHLGGLLKSGQLAEAFAFLKALRSSGQTLPLTGVLGYALPESISGWLRRARSHNALDWLREDWRCVSDSVATGYASLQGEPVNSALRACLRQKTVPGFLHYEDRNSMAFGVETRIPFLDHRLVEKVLPLSGAFKLGGARTKAVLRDAVAGQVPAMITARLAKQGYPAPLARWLRNASEAANKNRLELVADCPIIAFYPWHARFRKFLAGDDTELNPVWRGLILSLWHERFIKGVSR